MGLLNPGGSRSVGGRLFDFGGIRDMLRRQKPDHLKRGRGSIAMGNRWGGPHEHKRERARNASRATKR